MCMMRYEKRANKQYCFLFAIRNKQKKYELWMHE